MVPAYDVERIRLTLEPGDGQGPPIVVARLDGTMVTATYGETPSEVAGKGGSRQFRRTVELALDRGRYRIAESRGGAPATAGDHSSTSSGSSALGGITLRDVAAEVGLDFRQGAFRFGMSNDTTSMMGGGVCWIDYDDDGWLDLFVVNSYTDTEFADWDDAAGRRGARSSATSRGGSRT